MLATSQVKDTAILVRKNGEGEVVSCLGTFFALVSIYTKQLRCTASVTAKTVPLHAGIPSHEMHRAVSSDRWIGPRIPNLHVKSSVALKSIFVTPGCPKKDPFGRAVLRGRCWLSRNYTQIVYHLGSKPFNLVSRLLAPITTLISPSGFLQPCFAVSHIDRSYRDKLIVTDFFCPGLRERSVNPFRTAGGSPESTGKLT